LVVPVKLILPYILKLKEEISISAALTIEKTEN